MIIGYNFFACHQKNPFETPNTQILTFYTSENIDSTQTWQANEIHVVQKSITISNAILTIMPGATIKFAENSGIIIHNNAGIIADGSQATIRFTVDDSSAGFWNYLYFTEKSLRDSCKLINCSFSFGGGDLVNPATLICDNAAPEIRSCTISHSANHGVILRGDCRGIGFFNNSINYCAKAPLQTSVRNVPFIGLNSYQNNQESFIDITDNLISVSTVWYDQPLRFRLLQGLTIEKADLQISPGMELSFAANKGLFVSNSGSMKADGSLAAISFTGVENANWQGIIFESTSNSSSSSLINCCIEYGGSDITTPANVTLYESAPQIENCEIKNSSGYGIYVVGNFFPATAVNNLLISNSLGAISVAANAVASVAAQKFGTDLTNFIHVRGGNGEGIISTDCVWKDLNVPYKIENTIQIFNSTLTLDPKLHLIMSAGSEIEVNSHGGLIADGSLGLITIEGQEYSAGYWGNIYFAQQAQVEKCKLIHCKIRHGGGNINQPGMIYSEICAPVIRNCYLENSGSWGVYFTQRCSLADLNTNFFYNNVAGDFYFLP